MDINQVWPEWNEDCVLGEGSFGKVYRAKRIEYGRTFYSAIKVLTVPKNQQEIKLARSQGMNDSEIYSYFRGLVDSLLNEITLMDNLKGANNIVAIDDYKIIEREGEIGWDVFIRMELLTPFDSFISNPGFSQKDVIRLGVDICTALEICEQNCIVHRDIKPDNIFISRFGEYKLGDFGIARKLEATRANLSRKGTLNYMAPEVYKSEEYGPNVDIYSLGLVLYTLLNNNRTAFLPSYPQPISYNDNEEALSKRLSGVALPPPCNANPSLSATIMKACAYRPQDRYQTATEFKNALIAEWNVIVQSGENHGIQSDLMRFDVNIEERLKNTTNDMTAHGRLVVEEYSQDTEVLGQEINSNTFLSNKTGLYQNEETYAASASYGHSSNKVCRVIALPMAIINCVLAFVLMFKAEKSVIEQTVSISLLGVGISILLAERNKKAVGISVSALSLSYIVEGVLTLIGGLQNSVPVAAIVVALSGVLMFFGGVAMVFQKNPRFGGALCVYALVIEWLFNIYFIINKTYDFCLWHICCSICMITVLVWSYGYKNEGSLSGGKMFLQIVTYFLSAIVAIQAIVFTVMAL